MLRNAGLLRRSRAELEAILDFLREGTRFQAEHANRVRRQAQTEAFDGS